MSLITVSQAQDGVTGVNAAAINTPVNTIANDYNGNITNANVSASAAIDFSKIAGGSSTSLLAWQAWTPSWTNLTIGNATVTARYVTVGKKVTCYLRVTLGSTSSVATSPTFSLPVTAASGYNTPNNILAIGYAEDAGIAGSSIVIGIHNSVTVGSLFAAGASGTYVVTSLGVSSTVPFTWGVGDYFNATFEYEAA